MSSNAPKDTPTTPTERYPTPIPAPERTASPREQRRQQADAWYQQTLAEAAARAARVSR